MSALTVATGQVWRGVLHYTASRRTKSFDLDETAIRQLQQSLTALDVALQLSSPPLCERKSVCRGCSYALLCWGEATDDEDD